METFVPETAYEKTKKDVSKKTSLSSFLPQQETAPPSLMHLQIHEGGLHNPKLRCRTPDKIKEAQNS